MKEKLLLLCFCLVTFLSKAQLPNVASPTIIPQNPTAASNIKVLVRVTAPSSMIVVDPNLHNVTGLQIKIKGCYSTLSGFGSLTVTDTITIGQLPVGNYQIVQKAYLSSTQQHCTPIDSNQVSLSLNVVSGTVTTTTGLGELATEGKLEVYPNPCLNKLFINGISYPAGVSVFSTDGKLVKKELLNKNPLNMQDLPAGVYFISINDKGKNLSTKFVKSEAGH